MSDLRTTQQPSAECCGSCNCSDKDARIAVLEAALRQALPSLDENFRWQFDARRDGLDSYTLAITAIRELKVRSGEVEPTTDIERSRAAQGPVPVRELDCVRGGE